MLIEIKSARLNHTSLIVDYLAEDEKILKYFSGSPFSGEAYARIIRLKKSQCDRNKRNNVLALLTESEYNQKTAKVSTERLNRFLNDGGVVITTGQQAGLFGGPLFTFYKALTAIKIAKAVENRFDCAALPVFWVNSDDHDIGEIDHTFILDLNNDVRKLELDFEGENRNLPASQQMLSGIVSDLINEVAEVTPDTEFKSDCISLLRSAYTVGRSFSGAFIYFLKELTSQFGLFILDSSDSKLKSQSIEFFSTEIKNARANRYALEETTNGLESDGYNVQVDILKDSTNLFQLTEQGRERIFSKGDSFSAGRSNKSHSQDQLIDMINSYSERFSPNVLSRPVLESYLLPVVVYVGGPGEIAYFAQLKRYFEKFDLEMPLVYPRFSAFLIEGKVRKVLNKYDLDCEDLSDPSQARLKAVIREALPGSIGEYLSKINDDVSNKFEELSESVIEIDPNLVSSVQKTRNSIFVQLKSLESKILFHYKKANETIASQIDKAKSNLFPLGKPQERVFNIVPYLIRYGQGILNRIYDSIELDIR